ncbi:hypothetical protein MSG28_004746 [Choristoneura fumiferana]|uniref:Uncharacterized protein n=1 Tax=Choristoneura fumiferana TaxID=7141 RepID=A0ACC0K7X0_CHOFU|nr:hypothetical protein MSG28_004746 [Choristoneura fumiferana]
MQYTVVDGVCDKTTAERKVLRKILGPVKRDDGTWRTRKNREIQELVAEPYCNIIGVTKSHRLRWFGLLLRMGEDRAAKRAYVGRPAGRRQVSVDFVEKWPVMNSNDLAFILISYLMFVLKIGPMIMEKRAPLQLRGILIAYNMSKIINSGILTYKFFFYIVDKGLFPKKCNHDEVTLHVSLV